VPDGVELLPDVRCNPVVSMQRPSDRSKERSTACTGITLGDLIACQAYDRQTACYIIDRLPSLMLSFLFIRAPLELYSETWSIDNARKVQLFKCDQNINVHTYQSDSFEDHRR
jgi:hypothetical protein